MSSNRYYDEWDAPREAILLRDVATLTIKYNDNRPPVTQWAHAGERVQIEGRMTEDTRDSYGGRWLYNMSYAYGGSLVEHGVDFEFIELNDSYYVREDGETYCTEPNHDSDPVDPRYGCRYCSKADNE